jgi:hypothetical protein
LDDLAQKLWYARCLGRTIDAASCELPTSKDEAYAIQDAIVDLSGLPLRGYKVGSTSKEAQRLLGTDEPGAARRLDSPRFWARLFGSDANPRCWRNVRRLARTSWTHGVPYRANVTGLDQVPCCGMGVTYRSMARARAPSLALPSVVSARCWAMLSPRCTAFSDCS